MRGDPESISNDREKLAAFLAAVTDLAEGALVFPPPFDLATSSALALNNDLGDLAEKLFEVSALRDCGFHVQITALAPGTDTQPLRRDVVNTTVGSVRLLLALLDDVAFEVEAQQNQ